VPIDPYIAAKLARLPDVPITEVMSDPALLSQVMELLRDDRPYAPPAVRVDEESVPAAAGPFRVRIYRPADGSPGRPAVVWVHGGGFVGGSIDDNEGDLVSRELCARAQAVVVSVDYHLADGAAVTYPTLHREVAAAVRWTRENSARLRIDEESVTLGGASAGGNLAVAATLELRALDEPLPRSLLLIYPLLHSVIPRSPEVLETCSVLPGLVRFSPATVDLMFGAYRGQQESAPYLTPEGHDLAGLPPCLVIVSEYDDLRASGEAFACAARADGVDVDEYLARGVIHGHLNLTPLVPEVDATLQRLADAVVATRSPPPQGEQA
jgi:acetyl esterase